MAVCANCNAEIGENDKFCGSCGAPTASKSKVKPKLELSPRQNLGSGSSSASGERPALSINLSKKDQVAPMTARLDSNDVPAAPITTQLDRKAAPELGLAKAPGAPTSRDLGSELIQPLSLAKPDSFPMSRDLSAESASPLNILQPHGAPTSRDLSSESVQPLELERTKGASTSRDLSADFASPLDSIQDNHVEETPYKLASEPTAASVSSSEKGFDGPFGKQASAVSSMAATTPASAPGMDLPVFGAGAFAGSMLEGSEATPSVAGNMLNNTESASGPFGSAESSSPFKAAESDAGPFSGGPAASPEPQPQTLSGGITPPIAQPVQSTNNVTGNGAVNPCDNIKDYLLESILVLVCCCQLFGAISLVLSIICKSKKTKGDADGAREIARYAHYINIAGGILGLIISLFYVVVLYVGNSN